MVEHQGHLHPRRFCEYLAGLLDDRSTAAFEEHVAACPECARVLQREAMLEMDLFEAAQPKPRLPRRERLARWTCAVMAAAAAVLLVLADPAQYLQLDSLGSSAGPSDDAIAFSDLVSDLVSDSVSDSVCMPDSAGDDATCEEPLTVAMATAPASSSNDPFGLEPYAPTMGGGCWLDEQVIDPLCVTTDPLAG